MPEISFLCRLVGLPLRDRARSSAIWEELGVEPLLLHFEKSQVRWFGHRVRTPPRRLPGEVFRTRPYTRRPPKRPWTPWRDVSWLAQECLGISPEELEEVAGKREFLAQAAAPSEGRINNGRSLATVFSQHTLNIYLTFLTFNSFFTPYGWMDAFSFLCLQGQSNCMHLHMDFHLSYFIQLI